MLLRNTFESRLRIFIYQKNDPRHRVDVLIITQSIGT